MTIMPPIPEIQFDHENSRSKVKVKYIPVSAASCWLISLVFHIRASYQLPSPSFHDNRASHSGDTIWPWKLKVTGKGQRHPSQRSIKVTHFLTVSHQVILSTPVLSFHDKQTTHSRDTLWLSKFKINDTPVSAASSWLISLVFHIRASYRLPSLSFHDNRASHSWDTIQPSKFKAKGQGQSTLVSVASSWLIYFLSHQLDQPFLRYGK